MAIDIKQIWADVQENQRKLNSCSRHDFSVRISRRTKEPFPENNTEAFCYWRCSNCGGYVEFTNKKYYELGLKHNERTQETSAPSPPAN